MPVLVKVKSTNQLGKHALIYKQRGYFDVPSQNLEQVDLKKCNVDNSYEILKNKQWSALYIN